MTARGKFVAKQPFPVCNLAEYNSVGTEDFFLTTINTISRCLPLKNSDFVSKILPDSNNFVHE
jgi:hypothetical protein